VETSSLDSVVASPRSLANPQHSVRSTSCHPGDSVTKRLIALIAFTTVAGGCQLLKRVPQSAFLSRFSLDRSVKQTAYKGINNSGGSSATLGGDVGMGGGTLGPRGAKASLSSATAFTINQDGDNKFMESEFMQALASQVKKEIEDNHASVTGSGTQAGNEFYVEYKVGRTKGRITISGSVATAEAYYIVRAKVDESSE
jgi:hypothetical protein